MPKAQTVNTVFLDCLYRNTELPRDSPPPEDAVLVDGITLNVGFHPGRLESHRAEIQEMFDDLHPEFTEGMSFLRMCLDRKGALWGEHPTMQKLMCLGVGLKIAEYCAPKHLWQYLPGGMPYLRVKQTNREAVA